MCIAILNTANLIDKNTLKTCWNNNNDGAGLLYPERNKVHVFKELKSFKVFYREYVSVRNRLPEANILIHFRISTHGKVNETNCHPFLVNEKLGFIHNGIINSEHLPISPDFSDTYLFNQIILKKLPANFIDSEAVLSLLEKYIGYSKIIFLDSKNNWQILNENSGIWNGENWYSNSSYIPYVYTAPKVPLYSKNDYLGKYDSWNIPEYKHEAIYCDCCNEITTETKYAPNFNIDMCPSCYDTFIDKEYQY